jgi:hypothetical protein
MSESRTIDAAVLSRISAGACEFREISLFCYRKFPSVATHASGFRKIDRSLQRLRKAGLIERRGLQWHMRPTEGK